MIEEKNVVLDEVKYQQIKKQLEKKDDYWTKNEIKKYIKKK